jgi:glyoxylase-like metal-dependent hydrolase (beta-lactamase superfamily II)
MNGVADLRNFANRTWRSLETAALLSVRRARGRIGSLEALRQPTRTTFYRGGSPVLIAGFPAGSFATNCYVVAPSPGEECIIIDPGQDAEPGVTELLAEYRLRPVAVLATHGHVDHIWSVAPVCGAQGIPAYIHPADRDLLSDPAKGFPLQVGQQLFRGLTFTEPDDVIALADGMTLRLAGVELVVDHTPGHTPGSVTFRTGNQGGSGGSSPRANTVLFSGDLLFAGSIGRTDLPGGDYPTILDSLSRVCLVLPDDTRVLPGHGPQTTIGAERATNKFLAGLAPGPGASPRSGPASAAGPTGPGL